MNIDNVNDKVWSICGILDEDTGEVRSELSCYSIDDIPCDDYHETLKRHRWDDPMRWRYNRDGFYTTIPNKRPFTAKELDLIIDHILTKYPGLKHHHGDGYRPWNTRVR